MVQKSENAMNHTISTKILHMNCLSFIPYHIIPHLQDKKMGHVHIFFEKLNHLQTFFSI